MGHLRTCVLVGLFACGSNSNSKTPDAPIIVHDAAPDSKVFMDAPPPPPDAPPTYDFSCFGQPLPTTANAQVMISGTARVVTLQGTTPNIGPLAGATLKGCKVGAANCTGQNQVGATATSDANGLFSIGPITTNGTPVDAYMVMTANGDRTIQLYPPYPVTMDFSNIPPTSFDNTLITLINASGVATQSPQNGMLGLFVTDCASTPIVGATASVQQGGVDVGTVIDGSTFSSMAAGVFFAFDVPPGNTTVTATYGGMTFRTSPAQVVPSIAGTTTETQVRPGP